MRTEPVELRDGTKATTLYVNHDEIDRVPASVLEQMRTLMNDVIEEGQTYPLTEQLDLAQFKAYWMHDYCIILVEGQYPEGEVSEDAALIGTVYLKPNYPHQRTSHVVNGGFLVNPQFRRRGVAQLLGKKYLEQARNLGYRYSMFNLVFVTNTGSVKAWDALGFDRIGLVPGAAYLKGYDEPVDAIIFGKSLV